jgi:hypothetical protein
VTNVLSNRLPLNIKITYHEKKMDEHRVSKFINLLIKSVNEHCQSEYRILIVTNNFIVGYMLFFTGKTEEEMQE